MHHIEEKFTIEEFWNYLLTQKTRADIIYHLNGVDPNCTSRTTN